MRNCTSLICEADDDATLAFTRPHQERSLLQLSNSFVYPSSSSRRVSLVVRPFSSHTGAECVVIHSNFSAKCVINHFSREGPTQKATARKPLKHFSDSFRRMLANMYAIWTDGWMFMHGEEARSGFPFSLLPSSSSTGQRQEVYPPEFMAPCPSGGGEASLFLTFCF